MNHNFITNNIRENEWKWWKLNGELVISPADMNCDILGCTETKDTWVTLKLVFLYHLCILMIGKLRIWYQLMPLTSGGDGSLHWWPLIVEPMIANGLVKGKTDWWNQELNSLKSRLFQVQVCFLTKILKHQRSNHLPRSHLTWGLNAHDSSEVTSWFRSRSPARSSSVLVKSLALKILVNNKRSFYIAGKW
jgi:hypothetical protein